MRMFGVCEAKRRLKARTGLHSEFKKFQNPCECGSGICFYTGKTSHLKEALDLCSSQSEDFGFRAEMNGSYGFVASARQRAYPLAAQGAYPDPMRM